MQRMKQQFFERHVRRLALVLGLMGATTLAWAQNTTVPAAAAASAAARRSAAAASAPAAAASAASSAAQRVEVIGGRQSDTEQRRQSTAAKIVIGREEIEKFGDATVGEVLRRLPGITTPGAPGRGGPPRMRGLGGGFTQLLIDGQRVPPGFSLESLSPEQIERIEILRAPTAETGARAIAGTINIITREGFTRRLNEVRLGVGSENGRGTAGGSWNHNDVAGNLTYTLSAALFGNHRLNSSHTDTDTYDVLTGQVMESRRSATRSTSQSVGLHLNARLQWRLGEGGDSLVLMPGLFSNRSRNRYHYLTDEVLRRTSTPEYAAFGDGRGGNSFTGPRLTATYRQRVGDWRLEGGGNVGHSRSQGNSSSEGYRVGGSFLRGQQDQTASRENSLRLNMKGSRLVGGEGSEHSLVLGAEAETAQRTDSRITLQRDNNEPWQRALADFGEDFQASTVRGAAFVQDEWSLDKHWALHAGLRWEGITTRGDDGLGTRPENRNSVWTPLVHVLWKPDPAKRDQVRLSLTRSWRAPATNTLIGRPSITRLYPADTCNGFPNCQTEGNNTRTAADSSGNPNLKPELATGLDLAFERFLDGGGLLSANLFYRRISDLMRSEVLLEDHVGWSPYPRWVRRTRNIGNATTAGLELEAKFRLDQVIEGATPVELRANAAFYNSKVDQVPGPNNRLDQQARATANLGADYRLRGTPLTLGGNLNWVPSTLVRLAEDQTTQNSTKRVWDVFALWTFSPTVGLRLLANNALPRDYETLTVVDSLNPITGRAEQTRSNNGGPSATNWQLRLEMKL
jgi:outer membrane receptor for ferrienterochelin and colicins